jgi:hypothetical protein
MIDGAEGAGLLDARAYTVNRCGNGFVGLIFQNEYPDRRLAGTVEAGADTYPYHGRITHEFCDVLLFDLASIFDCACRNFRGLSRG